MQWRKLQPLKNVLMSGKLESKVRKLPPLNAWPRCRNDMTVMKLIMTRY